MPSPLFIAAFEQAQDILATEVLSEAKAKRDQEANIALAWLAHTALNRLIDTSQITGKKYVGLKPRSLTEDDIRRLGLTPKQGQEHNDNLRETAENSVELTSKPFVFRRRNYQLNASLWRGRNWDERTAHNIGGTRWAGEGDRGLILVQGILSASQFLDLVRIDYIGGKGSFARSDSEGIMAADITVLPPNNYPVNAFPRWPIERADADREALEDLFHSLLQT